MINFHFVGIQYTPLPVGGNNSIHLLVPILVGRSLTSMLYTNKLVHLHAKKKLKKEIVISINWHRAEMQG